MDRDAVLRGGHIVPPMEAGHVTSPPATALPSSPRATMRCVFPHLPCSAATGPLPARIVELLHERAHGSSAEAKAVAADALHSLALINDALGRVLVDADIGVTASGASVRGMDVLAQLAEARTE